jgi:hypothetical protein
MLKNYAVIAIREYFEFVRFEHTVFALPFALTASIRAARYVLGWPPATGCVAMVSAARLKPWQRCGKILRRQQEVKLS